MAEGLDAGWSSSPPSMRPLRADSALEGYLRGVRARDVRRQLPRSAARGRPMGALHSRRRPRRSRMPVMSTLDPSCSSKP
jgi:hypothetical protein